MKLYDLSKNRIVQFPDYIAKLKLRRKHISQGGIYCTVAEISKYVSTPPVSKEETTQPSSAIIVQADYNPVEQAKKWDEQYPVRDIDPPHTPVGNETNQVKPGRKRKPKS